MTRLGLISVVVLAGCTCSERALEGPALVSEVKRLITERDAKLRSYRIEVETTEGEHQARHSFAFRSPNKSRGHVFAPQEVEVAFDGAKLVRVLYPSKVVEPIPLDLAPAERAYFLASTFMPFAPEGFRAPLLPMSGVEAKRGGEVNVVELRVKPAVDVEVTYVLRLPAVDFVEKRTKSGSEQRVLRVVKEQCDQALGLCVPVELEEMINGTPLGKTRVTKVELNVELPQEFFSP